MPTNQPTTKGGNIILRRVSVPDQVDPGEPYEVNVQVSNGASYINPWEPDKCGLAPPGYKLTVVLRGPSGERLTKGPVCHTTTEIGTRDETDSFTVTAPQSGRAEVSAYVEMENSGKRTDKLEASSLVASEAPAQPDTGSSDDGGGGGGSGLFDGSPDPTPGGGTSFDTYAEGAGLLIVLLAIAWLADSGASIAGD